MKHMKKALALLLVLVMAMSLLTVTAFAAGNGTITIENSVEGKTYNVYKVFDATYGTYAGTNSTAYTIKDTDPWYALVKDTDGTKNSPFEVGTTPVNGTTDTYQVTLKSQMTAENVINWFNSLADSDLPKAATASKEGTGKGSADALVFSGLDNGYYYVTSTLGTTITLTNLNNSIEITDKNQNPSWGTDIGTEEEKGGKLVLGDDGNWATSNTAAIGDTLQYKIVLNAAPNYTANGLIKEYQFSDDEGAAIYADLHSMKVYVDGKSIGNGYIKGFDSITGEDTTKDTWHKIDDTDHTGETPTTEPSDWLWYIENTVQNDDKFTIHIKWADANGEPLYPELSVSKIEVTYSALLEGNASVGEKTSNNENTVTARWLTENGGLESGRSRTTTTTTFGFAVEKKDSDSKQMLQGVEFQLKKSGSETPIQFYPSSVTGRYYVVNDAEQYPEDVVKTKNAQTSAQTSTLVTNANGNFLIVGLAGGDYVLTETKPLDGYNSIAPSTITLAVPSSSSSSSAIHTPASGWQTLGNNSTLVQTVLNSKGTTLPATGSTGTKLFILFGSVAVLGAGIFLVANKRMRKESF